MSCCVLPPPLGMGTGGQGASPTVPILPRSLPPSSRPRRRAHHDAVGLVDGPQVDAAVVPSCRQQPPGAFAQHQGRHIAGVGDNFLCTGKDRGEGSQASRGRNGPSGGGEGLALLGHQQPLSKALPLGAQTPPPLFGAQTPLLAPADKQAWA